MAVIFILFELKIEIITLKFYFLTFFFGKSIFALFCGCLCFNKNKWFSISVAVILWVICLIFFILGLIFKDKEKESFAQSTEKVEKTVEIDSTQNA